MKKFFILAAMAALALTSCNKDPQGGNDGDDKYPTIERQYRVKTMGDNWSDPYTFSYNADGTVKSVVSKWDDRQFKYEGSKLTITNGEAVEYVITLNKDGFATEVVKGDDTYTMEYDAHGYLTLGKKNGVQCTSQSIEDGNVLYWTRFDSENNFWRMKDATYLDDKNLGCIQTHYAEDLGFSRWMWEARLFGNTSVKMLESCVWHNFGDQFAAKTAVYTYEYDKTTGMPTQEVKYYGVWNGTDVQGMDMDTTTSFTWEEIK